ncbi:MULTISPECIES: hypothetical protein [Bradyrhizobium]|nr:MULTISPECIES: hypothetical protein [Bradyrhizobium]
MTVETDINTARAEMRLTIVWTVVLGFAADPWLDRVGLTQLNI